MKLLIALDPYGNKLSIKSQLIESGLQADDLTFVESAKALLEALIANNYDFIITEYTVDGSDVWRLSQLINATHLSTHACPIILIKETCQIDIPVILAKEYLFTVVALDDLMDTLTAYYQKSKGLNGQQMAKRNTLLIIEDDEDAVFSAYHALKDTYEIDVANDGLSGYTLWERNRHDLVLLDLMLPKISGEQILEKMMALNKNQSVIIITALDKPSMQNKLLLNGASEYLAKPFSLTELRILCQMLLSKSKLLHQTHYSASKIAIVRDLVWLLDYAMTQNDIEKVSLITNKLKNTLPNNLTEDEKINLLTREF